MKAMHGPMTYIAQAYNVLCANPIHCCVRLSSVFQKPIYRQLRPAFSTRNSVAGIGLCLRCPVLQSILFWYVHSTLIALASSKMRRSTTLVLRLQIPRSNGNWNVHENVRSNYQCCMDEAKLSS